MNNWLSGLPTTNFKAVCVVFITFCTMIALFFALWKQLHVDDATLAMWLTFVGGLWGFNFAQYWVKSNSQTPPSDVASPVAPIGSQPVTK